jgi:phytanoyl-CoA hydroxylase
MDVKKVRAAAADALEALEQELLEIHSRTPESSDDALPKCPRNCYWLGGFQRPVPHDATSSCRYFQTNGFLRVRQFASPETCQAMKDAMADLVLTQWHPSDDPRKVEEFGTDARQNTARGDYFLDSAENIHFFAETAALLPADAANDGADSPRLRPEYEGVHKIRALNKAGHALHLSPRHHDGTANVFHDYCKSSKVRELVKDLGWNDPVVPQSMYIFKQATTGGVVNSHQDSTFLFTTPYQSCLGLWLALDDATLENGCLWVRPKSHREAVRRQYKRNPLHFGSKEKYAEGSQEGDDAQDSSATAAPMFVMEDLYDHEVSWDGSVPETGVDGLLKAGFVPFECKAGDLVAFCGELDHLSLSNTSDRARHTFQLHLVEGPSENVTWSKTNWLQYRNQRPFLRLLAGDLRCRVGGLCVSSHSS